MCKLCAPTGGHNQEAAATKELAEKRRELAAIYANLPASHLPESLDQAWEIHAILGRIFRCQSFLHGSQSREHREAYDNYANSEPCLVWNSTIRPDAETTHYEPLT